MIHNVVFKTKGPQIRCILHGSLGLSQCKSNCKRTCWLTKISRKAKINSKKQRVLKCVAFLTGGEDWLNVNRTANNTLVMIKVLRIQPYSLISYRIKITKEKITLKPWFSSVEKRTRYLNVNRAARNKLVLTKIGA